jgi:hypothetical protein
MRIAPFRSVDFTSLILVGPPRKNKSHIPRSRYLFSKLNEVIR